MFLSIIKSGDFMRKKSYTALLVLFSGICSFIIYMLIGITVLSPIGKSADAEPEPVEDTRKIGDFSVLLSCDELSNYAALYADLDNDYISLFLFSDKEEAKKFGFSYNREIQYKKQNLIDLIGWIEGIVIDENICYNNDNYDLLPQGERIFGNRAIDVLEASDELRAGVAYSALRGVLLKARDETDFIFLLGLCESDISFADMYRHFPFLSPLADKINVCIVG